MKTKNYRGVDFIHMTLEEFTTWLKNKKITRQITSIQEHHTWSPNYKNCSGYNQISLCQNMHDYHVDQAKYASIAQNFTTFKDGTIVVCRDINTSPAGIYGQNSKGICIEHVGNFDKGGDILTEEHKKTIIGITKLLLDKLGLQANTNSIVYHHWFSLSKGNRTDGAGDTKTCPGTNFFGGNKVSDCQTNFIPLVKSYGKKVEPVKPKLPDWKDLIKKYTTQPDVWIKQIDLLAFRVKSYDNYKHLGIFEHLPDLLEKVGNRPDINILYDAKTLISKYTKQPFDWEKGIKEVIKLTDKDLQSFKFIMDLIYKIGNHKK